MTSRPLARSASATRRLLRALACAGIAGLIGLSVCDRAAAFSEPIGPFARPTGLTADGAVVTDNRGVALVSAAGTRRVLRNDRVWSAAGSATRVIAYVGTAGASIATTRQYQNPDIGITANASEIYAGPVGPTLRRIARCGPVENVTVVPPVAAGDTVAWLGCDHSRLELDTVGSRSTIDVDGTIVGLDGIGSVLTWVAARGDAPAVVERLDLSSGARSEIGSLPPLGNGADPHLSTTAAGRVRVSLEQVPGSSESRCDVFDASPGGGLAASANHSCGRARLSDTGNVGPTNASFGLDYRVVVRDELAGTVMPLVTGRRSTAPSVFVAGSRVAYTSPTCAGQTLVVGDLATVPVGTPPTACRVRLRSRRAQAGRRGRVPIRLSCPRGCGAAVINTTTTTDGGARSGGVTPSRVRAGGHPTVSVQLHRKTRRRLDRGETVSVKVDVLTLDGRSQRVGTLVIR